MILNFQKDENIVVKSKYVLVTFCPPPPSLECRVLFEFVSHFRRLECLGL
jgi:hypothetical protein